MIGCKLQSQLAMRSTPQYLQSAPGRTRQHGKLSLGNPPGSLSSHNSSIGRAKSKLSWPRLPSNHPLPGLPAEATQSSASQLCQAWDASSRLAPFPASEHALRITTDEVNPDVDIHPLNAYDVIISQGLAYSYSPDGRCIESLSLQAFSSLHCRYSSTPTPASDPPLDTFPAALARLLSSHTKCSGHHQTQHTLTGHAYMSTAVLDTIMSAYELQTHWLAGPLQAHSKAANFAPFTYTCAAAAAFRQIWCPR